MAFSLLLNGMGQAQPGQNPAKNGSFEEIRNELPANWMAPGYGREKANIKIYVEKNGAFAGDHFVTIECVRPFTGRLIQFVTVQPDRMYRFSCRIKAAGEQTGKGAFISVMNTPAASTDIKETGGEWQYVEFFGRTGPEQTQVAAALQFGIPASLNTGKASFDDFRVEEVTGIPQGSKAVNLYRDIPDKPARKVIFTKNPRPVISVSFLLVCLMLLFPGVYYLLLRQKNISFLPGSLPAKRQAEEDSGIAGLSYRTVFYAFLAAAFLLRLLLAPVIEGYPIDIFCFKGWSGVAADHGLPDFYLSDTFVDYPPGYIYILYIIGLLRKLFSIDPSSTAFLILIKSPALIADMLTAFILFRVGKKEIGFAAASLLSLFYAFNPAVIFDSAIYGQIDSVFVLLLVISFVLVYKDKLPGAVVAFVIAVLVKPQALIFSPILLFAFIRKPHMPGGALNGQKTVINTTVNRGSRMYTFLVSAFWSIITFIVLLLPFSIKQEPTWIFKLYKSTLASYPFASLNAFNFFALFGGNWANDTEIFFIFSYKTWGFIFIAAITAFAALLYFRSKDKSGIYFTAMFIMTAVFVLSSKMHERYLFPSIILALFCYLYTRQKRMLFLFGAFTFSFLVNVAMVLHFMLNLTKSGIPKRNFLLIFISLINIVLLVVIVITGIQKYVIHKSEDKAENKTKLADEQ